MNDSATRRRDSFRQRARRRRVHRVALLAATGLAALPSLADAHITLNPDRVPAGSFSRVDVRVPNEQGNASTTKVVLKFPPGFISASYQPVPGWTVHVNVVRPAAGSSAKQPEQVDTVTFTTRGKGIGPGQFQDFGLALDMPAKAGTTLTFKAVQTYSNGAVERWIGGPDADEPAPHVALTATATTRGIGAAATRAPGPVPDAAAGDRGGSVSMLAIAALALGALGLLGGLAALRMARRAATAKSGSPKLTDHTQVLSRP
jgi:uncharacterized protein YcnI